MFHNIQPESFLLGVVCVVYPVIAYIAYIFYNYEVMMFQKVKDVD